MEPRGSGPGVSGSLGDFGLLCSWCQSKTCRGSGGRLLGFRGLGCRDLGFRVWGLGFGALNLENALATRGLVSVWDVFRAGWHVQSFSMCLVVAAILQRFAEE